MPTETTLDRSGWPSSRGILYISCHHSATVNSCSLSETGCFRSLVGRKIALYLVLFESSVLE